MRNQSRSGRHRNLSAADPVVPEFEPVPLRVRHDGWTPERQIGFIEALAQSACVEEACRRVGMRVSSAYALRQRVDARSFREAWDAALDFAVKRVSDGAFSRAVNGVEVPVFFQGEQIGTRRCFDERLTMFILRYRDPVRYGKYNDRVTFTQHDDGPALLLSRLTDWLGEDSANRIAIIEDILARAAKTEEKEGDAPPVSSTSDRIQRSRDARRRSGTDADGEADKSIDLGQ